MPLWRRNTAPDASLLRQRRAVSELLPSQEMLCTEEPSRAVDGPQEVCCCAAQHVMGVWQMCLVRRESGGAEAEVVELLPGLDCPPGVTPWRSIAAS